MTWHDLRREPTVHLGRRRRLHLTGRLGVSLCGRTIDPSRAETSPPDHLKCERCQRAYDRRHPPAPTPRTGTQILEEVRQAFNRDVAAWLANTHRKDTP